MSFFIKFLYLKAICSQLSISITYESWQIRYNYLCFWFIIINIYLFNSEAFGMSEPFLLYYHLGLKYFIFKDLVFMPFLLIYAFQRAFIDEGNFSQYFSLYPNLRQWIGINYSYSICCILFLDTSYLSMSWNMGCLGETHVHMDMTVSQTPNALSV